MLPDVGSDSGWTPDPTPAFPPMTLEQSLAGLDGMADDDVDAEVVE